MKYCNQCKQYKNTTEFHKNHTTKDGLQAYCNDCLRIYAINHYHTKEGRKTHDRGRQHYNQSAKGKATQKRHQTLYYKKHPEMFRARSAVRYAIKSGKLIPPKYFLCYEGDCLEQAQDYHHNKGYAKEHYLDVEPVCRICHQAIHKVS